jgi:hypothetical protein
VQHREHQRTFTQRTHRALPRAPGVRSDTLIDLAQAIARAEDYWRPLVHHYDADRWFVRLYGTLEVEAWLLTWTEAQGVELHDHGGSSGAVLVAEGSLTEDYCDLTSPAPLRRAVWPRGSVHAFGASHVHDLRNTDAEPATSIHVYSPPLTSMTFYERGANGRLIPKLVEQVRREDHLDLAVAR